MPHTSETKICVRYSETDQMGIVHHSRYFPWLEIARSDFIKSSGISYGKIEDMGVMMPIVEASIKYVRGAKYEDEIIIHTKIDTVSPVKISFSYTLIRPADGCLIADAKTTLTFVDESFKPINLKKKHPNIWEKIEALSL